MQPFDAGGLGLSAMRLPISVAASTLPPCRRRRLARARPSRRSGADEHLRAVFGDDAGVDVQIRAEDGQTGHALQGNAGTGLTGAAQALFFLFNMVRLLTSSSSLSG